MESSNENDHTRVNPIHLIGTGHVAWNLAKAFQEAGIPIGMIWSRTSAHARDFADEFHTIAAESLEALKQTSGLILICVPDHAIKDMIQACEAAGLEDQLVCHTSGATSLDVFSPNWHHAGVFYPLQTLTKGHVRDFSTIPILLSARNQGVMEQISLYARTLSKHVAQVSDQDRVRLHLAAVMVNNFVFHLVDKAFDEVERHGLDPAYLHPLLEETVRKVIEHRGERVQTGPAIRGDINSLVAHLKLLADNPGLAGLYRKLSRSINPEIDI